MKSKVDRRIFFILLALCLLSVLAVFPYVLTLQQDLLEEAGIPIPTLILAQLIQSVILFSIAIFIGLKLAKKVNFKLPFLEAVVLHKDYKKILKDIFFMSVILGVITAILIYVVDYLFTLMGAGISTHQDLAPVWQKILASFYGGITEEILMRLFLMTSFVFIGMKILKQSSPGKNVIIISIIIAAVIFGLGHLPITATLTDITPLVVFRAIILNGIGGIVFGYLYWKKGLESAMIAHFSTDIVLLTLLPLIFS